VKEDRLVFGELENIKVGQIFKDRAELSKARIHGPPIGRYLG